jgi:hypothetical protein
LFLNKKNIQLVRLKQQFLTKNTTNLAFYKHRFSNKKNTDKSGLCHLEMKFEARQKDPGLGFAKLAMYVE